MNKELVCIQCPQGCRLKVSHRGSELVVEGNKCPRGVNYAREELTNPSRTLTTTVSTIFPDFPLLPVRTQGEIPLVQVFAAMGEINSTLVTRRLRPGDIVLPSLAGTGIALIATDDMTISEQAAAGQ